MKQQDEKQFIDLISTHEGVLHKITRMYAGAESERQDLFQEMVIQLWKSFSSFKGTSAFSTWMYRVAINTAISGFRKEQKQVKPLALGNIPEQTAYEPAHFDSDNPIEELYTAIESLSGIEKGIVFLYLEDRTYEEMAEIIGISSGTLRVKMNRIKEKLRQLTKLQYGTRQP